MRERLDRLDEACQVIKSLWTEKRSNFKGRFYQLSDAPLDPKPVQTPHPELMIGGGGEKVTLRIVAKHADHWNVWGGPKILAKKGAILDEHCAAVGRDQKSITRSANMALHITDKKEDVERLAETIATRMGRHAADARDTCLAGTPDQIREQLHQLQAAGVGVLFIPSMFRPLPELQRDLDRFIAEIAPAFRVELTRARGPVLFGGRGRGRSPRDALLRGVVAGAACGPRHAWSLASTSRRRHGPGASAPGPALRAVVKGLV